MQPTTISTNKDAHTLYYPTTHEAPMEEGLNGSQARIACDPQVANLPTKVHRGLDFLKVSFWIGFSSDHLFELLEDMKKKLQESDFDQVAAFQDKGIEWNLHRTGTKFYNYRLSMGDVTLLLNTRNPEGVVPTARLEMGSLTSQTKFYSIYEDIKHWLEFNGGKIVKERISEVHLAADFIGTDIKELDIANEDKWIHRCVTFTPRNHYRKLNSVTIGQNKFMLRIYNKVLELKRSHHKQEVFAEIWGLNKYDELPVTRVEYQIRREVLREFKGKKDGAAVHSVKDLLLALQALWKYCTTDWSRFMATVIDRKNKHQSRADYSDFWNVVRSVVWTGIHEFNRIKRTKHKDIVALRKQTRGLLMSIMAFFVEDPDDIEQIVVRSKNLIEEDLYQYFEDEKAFIKKMKIKRAEAIVSTVPF